MNFKSYYTIKVNIILMMTSINLLNIKYIDSSKYFILEMFNINLLSFIRFKYLTR